MTASFGTTVFDLRTQAATSSGNVVAVWCYGPHILLLPLLPSKSGVTNTPREERRRCIFVRIRTWEWSLSARNNIFSATGNSRFTGPDNNTSPTWKTTTLPAIPNPTKSPRRIPPPPTPACFLLHSRHGGGSFLRLMRVMGS